MKHSRLFIVLAAGIAFFASCDKVDDALPKDEEPKGKSKKEIAADGKWQYSGLTYKLKFNGKDTTMDLYAEMDECTKDDFMTFTLDGNGVIDEGPTKCKATDPQTETYTWEMLNNDTYVKVKNASGERMMEILELTATQAKYREYDIKGTDSNVYISTFKNIK